MYEKEQNAGNDVRRIGEEGLFSMLREKNGKELANAKFSKVLTTDPHTYNTLKNEYKDGTDKGSSGAPNSEPPAKVDDGGPLAGKPVLHYAELLDDLIRRGKLPLARALHCTVTYHDPCYLGRYNGVYEAPRRVLRALGAEVVEMPRNRARSFCCGAGGGRIWMKDSPGIEERPAENRVKEALSLPGVECLVVACPKDLAMFQDAVKTVGAEGRSAWPIWANWFTRRWAPRSANRPRRVSAAACPGSLRIGAKIIGAFRSAKVALLSLRERRLTEQASQAEKPELREIERGNQP